MRVASLIGHSREVLREIVANPQRPVDLFLSRYFRGKRYLGGKDRRFISEQVYDTLRQFLRYYFLLTNHDYSPTNESVDSSTIADEILAASIVESESSTNFDELSEGTRLTIERLHEISDRLQSIPLAIAHLSENDRLAFHTSLPRWFVQQIVEDFPSDYQAILYSLARGGEIAIRANRLKGSREELSFKLYRQGISTTFSEFAPEGLILEKRLNLSAIAEFRGGFFEVQDVGSQMLAPLLQPQPSWRVFDACAGGGGKTLHLASLMEGRGQIVAHDLNSVRLENIVPRIERSGVANIELLDHSQYLRNRSTLYNQFDALLIDAPCTGTGTIRRNPGMRLTLDRGVLQKAVVEQAEILAEYSALVKPGGVMLYATCSLLRAENEDQVKIFLERNHNWEIKPVEIAPSLSTSEGFYRSFPHIHSTDGFFGAVLRRKSS